MNPNFENASESFKALNPHLFVGGLPSPLAKQIASCPLDSVVEGGKASQKGVGQRYRVTITVHRKRLLDSDNHIGGLKPLRDAIASWLKMDDGDDGVAWEYHQLKTAGTTGTFVKIEQLKGKESSKCGLNHTNS
jgi:hypothetical protein